MNAASIEPGEPGPDPAFPLDPLDDPEALAHGAGEPVADEGPGPRALPAAADEAQLVRWLEAVVEQDERALAALYDATVARVYSLVRRIVRREALAEEVVEDTYFQVWRQAPRFDPARGAAITWLLAMARSRAIDALRREARFRHEALDDGPGTEVADERAGHDELLELARRHADLHQALLQLGAQPRQLVSLAFFRGLTHEEIADHTRLPLGTVKSQIRRALQTLRQILGDECAWALAS
ncbi:MAG: sigma-70 family RNA polymerase sigma factor [Piscinibacter sp.]|uniref:sigma-70 family RNA polymerase sigma factor n=1 Tax=Piscinibacter TaxID=1114981 RepID=UPI000FDDD87A|nr:MULTISPECIES: sigma-70 family RNA polymerase sigma factor [Piscinibacter]MCW5666299.1 sigma-70 family RNA polymerase sigma factor [Piscinibacter sp.]